MGSHYICKSIISQKTTNQHHNFYYYSYFSTIEKIRQYLFIILSEFLNLGDNLSHSIIIDWLITQDNCLANLSILERDTVFHLLYLINEQEQYLMICRMFSGFINAVSIIEALS